MPFHNGGAHHLHTRFPCHGGSERQFQAGSVLVGNVLLCYYQCMYYMNYASPTKFNTGLPFKSRLCHELDLVDLPTWPLLAGFDRFWRNFIRLLATKRPFLAAQAGHTHANQAADRDSAHRQRRPLSGPGLRPRPRRFDSAACSICVPFGHRKCST